MKKKLSRSIAFKILFFYILLAFINISFIISIIFENQVELISTNAKLESEQQISALIGSLKQFSSEIKKGSLFPAAGPGGLMDQFIGLIQPYAPTYYIVSETGKVIRKSDRAPSPPPAMAEDILRSITTQNFSGKEYYLRIDDKAKSLYCYIPLGNFQMPGSILLIVKDMSILNQLLRRLYSQAIYVIMVAIFFHVIFALILFRYIIIPVRLLKQGADRLAGGDYNARISLPGRDDEFKSLAESFNTMADSISTGMTHLSGKAKSAIESLNRSDFMTVRDELTGLFSRIYMIERIREEMRKARTERHSVALVMIDIDNFKDIIRIYGKNSGDIIVLEISKIVARNSAETVTVSRFGEETIAVLLPGCPLERLREFTETIRHEIETATTITPDGTFNVTASIGASFADHEKEEKQETETDIIITAGAALAQAKKNGKNRVEII